jgi:LPS sulfotransferase NodH
LDEVVTSPVVVCGMPRTGTTLLSNLLGADPARRSLLNWVI